MRAGVLASLGLLAGCGHIHFDPLEGDAGVPDPDAPITARRWVNRNDGGPGKLLTPRMTYDDARRTVILYGGLLETDTPSASMWELTPDGWRSLCDPCDPGPRIGAGLTYDPVRDRIVLFDGRDVLNGGPLDELWEWDGTIWTKVATGGTVPAARDMTQALYDSDANAVLVVGGNEPPNGAVDDIFALSAGVWSEPAPSGGPGHAGGFGMSVARDPTTRLVYALGDDLEINNPQFRDDLWSWDGTSWMQVCAACTGRARSDASLVYDPDLAALYLVGGFDGVEIGGTWKLVGTQLEMTDPLPPARDSVGIAYDKARRVIVMYGGNGVTCNTGGGNCAETWEYVPDS